VRILNAGALAVNANERRMAGSNKARSSYLR
jgi:hypothetical protein